MIPSKRRQRESNQSLGRKKIGLSHNVIGSLQNREESHLAGVEGFLAHASHTYT